MQAIYALIDPRTECIRYVGQTRRQTPELRAGQMATPSYANMPAGKWLRELRDFGLRPKTRILDRNPIDGIDNAEKRWIANLQLAGADLLNISAGGAPGTGCVWSDERKRRLSETMQGRQVSEETRKKVSLAKIGKRRPDLGVINRKRAKLSDAQIIAIRSRLTQGERGADLAREFGVTPSIICLIRQNKRRPDLSPNSLI